MFSIFARSLNLRGNNFESAVFVLISKSASNLLKFYTVCLVHVVSVSCFGVRFSVMFHFMFVHYTFSSVWVAEWQPFGK